MPHLFHIGAEGQIGKAGIFKALIGDGAEGGRQSGIGDIAVIEGTAAHIFQALRPAHIHQVAGTESAFFQGMKGRGQGNIAQQGIALESILGHRFHAFGKGDIHQAVFLLESILADMLYLHAANGSRDLNAAGAAGIGGNGAGGSIKFEIAFGRFPIDDHGFFAAGPDAGNQIFQAGKSRLIGFHLIIGNIDHAILRQIGKFRIIRILHKMRANAFKGDALERLIIIEGGLDQRNRRRNNDGFHQSQIRQAVPQNDGQIARELNILQFVMAGQGSLIKEPDGIGNGQLCHAVAEGKGHILDPPDGNAVYLGGDYDMRKILEGGIALDEPRILIDLPFGGVLCQNRDAAKQHDRCQEEGKKLFHKIIPFIIHIPLSLTKGRTLPESVNKLQFGRKQGKAHAVRQATNHAYLQAAAAGNAHPWQQRLRRSDWGIPRNRSPGSAAHSKKKTPQRNAFRPAILRLSRQNRSILSCHRKKECFSVHPPIPDLLQRDRALLHWPYENRLYSCRSLPGIHRPVPV